MKNGATKPDLFDDTNRAYLLLTFTAWCWGGNAILSKVAVGQISPMLLVSLRWLGVLILLLVLASKYIKQDWSVLRQNLLYVCLMGALGFTSFNALFYIAAYSTTAINIGILQGAIPIFVLLGSYTIYKVRITSIQSIGVGVTLLGVAIVASGGDITQIMSMSVNPGDIFMLVACFLYAGYSIALSRRPAVSPLGLFTLMAIVAFITSLPLLAYEITTTGIAMPTTTGWVVVILVTLFPSLVAQVFFIQGVGLIGPNRAGVFVNLVPVFASIMAVLYLDETFETYHGLSLGLVLGGIWLSERGKLKPATA